MNIIIDSPGFNAGPTLESYITNQLNRLNGDRIMQADVTLFLGPEGTPERHHCEIRLEIPGNDLFVKKQGEYFETAISSCMDVLFRMEKEEKEKAIRARKANETIIQDQLVRGIDENDDDVELEDVVE